MRTTKALLIQTLKLMMAPHEKALETFNNGPAQISPEEIASLCKTINALETYQNTLQQIQVRE